MTSTGRYDFVTELGSGALGPLWAARVNAGPELGRLVSVRRVSGEGSLLDRLMVAGVTSLRFRHPGVSAVLDVVQGTGELLVVSEYVDGEPLDTLQRLAAVNRTPLSPPVVLRIVLDVVTALAAAHDHWTSAADPNALYGGVLPSSIFVAGFGDTLLSEVGVSAAVVRLGLLGERDDVVAYQAPEQLAGAAVDAQSDVFSIGALLWELLANRPLFGAASRFGSGAGQSLVPLHDRNKPVPRLDVVARAGTPVPRSIVELVARAVERDPKQRFASVEELLETFRRLPRETIATPEQVVVAVDRLARSAIQTRHERVAGATTAASQPPESAPGSGRPTFAPEAKTALATVLRKSQSSRPPRIDYLSEEEPTQRGGAQSATLQSDGSVVPAAMEAVLSPPRPKNRGAVIALAVIALGVALVLVALFYPRAEAGPPSSASAVAPSDETPPPRTPPAASEAAQEGRAPPTSEPAVDPEAAGAIDESPSEPTPSAAPVTRTKKPGKPSKPPKNKTFRPRGI